MNMMMLNAASARLPSRNCWTRYIMLADIMEGSFYDNKICEGVKHS